MPFPDGGELYRIKGNTFDSIYDVALQDCAVPTQSEVLVQLETRLKSSSIYAKTQYVHARVATDAGVLETIVSGNVEARNSYGAGDFIMRGSRGGQYPVRLCPNAFSIRWLAKRC